MSLTMRALVRAKGSAATNVNGVLWNTSDRTASINMQKAVGLGGITCV